MSTICGVAIVVLIVAFVAVVDYVFDRPRTSKLKRKRRWLS
jgi:hypothetical protein